MAETTLSLTPPRLSAIIPSVVMSNLPDEALTVERINSSDSPAFAILIKESLVKVCWATAKEHQKRRSAAIEHFRMCLSVLNAFGN